MNGFFRLACAVPSVFVADAEKNTLEIIKKIRDAYGKKASLVVFPELCVTAYSCGDLFLQDTLLKATYSSLARLCRESEIYPITIVVGAPIEISGTLYDCAVVISDGKICGIVPKTFLSESEGIFEKRYFASASDLASKEISSRELGFEKDYTIFVGSNLIFDVCGVKVGIEIGEDLTAPISPSAYLSMMGADLIVNIDAMSSAPKKEIARKEIVKIQSEKLMAGYGYVSAGALESTTDVVYSGKSIVAENGVILEESTKIADYLLISELDIDKVRFLRRKNTVFQDAKKLFDSENKTVVKALKKENEADGTYYNVRKNPFLPEENKKEYCEKIFDMQSKGLEKRLKVTGSKVVIGVSGGLDSALALLVCVEAMKNMGRPLTDIVGITMPCFGTSKRTYKNSVALMEKLGIQMHEINIKEACIKHFEDIGHDIESHDLTYENVQARERTQVLMDYAGKIGALVVGTGDMSELALGWCTYNGDHMSMYGVNAGVTKTMIPHIIESVWEREYFKEAEDILKDICLTPISPELLPLSEGEISQKTQDAVGPYELCDFFLYHMLEYGFSPSKIFTLTKLAFSKYTDEEILKWLKSFYKRFFSQQFKRSCLPDGVKVDSVGLSPRNSLLMPSDASAELWINEVEKL